MSATDTQVYRALDAGNVVRLQRVALRHDLKVGKITPAAVLCDPPWFAQDMRLLEFLEACPGVGPEKIRRVNLRGAQAWPPVNLLSSIGELGPNQREWLIEQLPTLVCTGYVRVRGR